MSAPANTFLQRVGLDTLHIQFGFQLPCNTIQMGKLIILKVNIFQIEGRQMKKSGFISRSVALISVPLQLYCFIVL